MINKKEYIRGFCKAAKAYGVAPHTLVKYAKKEGAGSSILKSISKSYAELSPEMKASLLGGLLSGLGTYAMTDTYQPKGDRIIKALLGGTAGGLGTYALTSSGIWDGALDLGSRGLRKLKMRPSAVDIMLSKAAQAAPQVGHLAPSQPVAKPTSTGKADPTPVVRNNLTPENAKAYAVENMKAQQAQDAKDLRARSKATMTGGKLYKDMTPTEKAKANALEKARRRKNGQKILARRGGVEPGESRFDWRAFASDFADSVDLGVARVASGLGGAALRAPAVLAALSPQSIGRALGSALSDHNPNRGFWGNVGSRIADNYRDFMNMDVNGHSLARGARALDGFNTWAKDKMQDKWHLFDPDSFASAQELRN